MKSSKRENKVLVAMSGGVDSSVAAAFLKKQGYSVMGGFMKNFSQEAWQGVVSPNCPWQEDWADVQAVCSKLNIEARAFNFEKEYMARVIDYFFAEYAKGRTPNPDIVCNKEIKFKLFLEKAIELGFDYIATGHYVRKQENRSLKSKVRNYELLKGADEHKDQSYFLYTLNQQQLAKTLFPLGGYTKQEIRTVAKEMGLPTAEKKDSVGICFVGEVDLVEFLKQRIPKKVGEIVTTDGQVVGQHENAAYYTVGQRHGFGIGGIGPFYMVGKNLAENKVVVTNQHDDDRLYSRTLRVDNIHWIDPETENLLPLTCQAQHRYRQKDQVCGIEKSDEGYLIRFNTPQRAVTPGQSVVFFQGDVLLGGGVIEKTG